MREQIEQLKNHANVGANAREFALSAAAARRPLTAVTDLHAVDRDRAGIIRLEQVHATQHGGLAAPRGADDADYLAARDVEIDAAQHLVLTKTLAQVAHLHQWSSTIRGHRRNGPPNVGSTGRACS